MNFHLEKIMGLGPYFCEFLLMGIEQQGALQSRSRSMWKGAGPS